MNKINKKAKKVIAILVILILSITTLVGCSVTDLAYLSLVREASNVERFSFEGEFTIEFVDPNSDVSRTWSSIHGRMVTRHSEMMTINVEISGEGIQSAGGEFYLDTTIRYGINDRRMPHNLNILMVNDKMYIPTSDFIDIMLATSKYVSGYSDRIISNLRTEAEREFADNDYIVFDFESFADEMSFMMYGGMMMTTMMGQSLTFFDPQRSNELVDIFFEAFTKMFAGLNSGMTSGSGNNFTLEITPANAFALFENALVHIQANKRTIFVETLALLEAIEHTFRDGDIMKEMYRMMRFELEDNEQEFYDVIDDMVAYFGDISDFDRDMFLLLFRGSYFRHTISRTGNTFNERVSVNITHMGQTYFTLSGQSATTITTVTPRAVDAEAPFDMMRIDRVWDEIYDRANPVQKITVSFWMDRAEAEISRDRIWPSASVIRVEGSNWLWMNLFAEGDVFYVPLRRVLETFGEEVRWNSETRTAYVMRNGYEVHFDGFIYDGTLYVNFGDLAKLGYTVFFEDDELRGRITLTISR